MLSNLRPPSLWGPRAGRRVQAGLPPGPNNPADLVVTCKGKNSGFCYCRAVPSSSCVFLPLESPLFLLRPFSSDIPVTKLCGGFSPHQSILCNTSWVLYNCTQFLYYLPGDSVTSHRLGISPTAPCPPTPTSDARYHLYF